MALYAVLLVLLALNTTAADVASAPVERKIVSDLTLELNEQLKRSSISLLLVLPGPQHHSSMKLDWREVTDTVERLNFIYNYEGFMSHWHGYYRYHRWHQLYGAHKRRTALQPQQKQQQFLDPYEYDDIHPLVQPTPPKVALLVRGEEGAVRSSQSNLAAAIARHVRHAHELTLAYSTHKDKGDSLLVFDRAGTPLKAHFLATTIFRDAFTAIYDKHVWGPGGGGSGHGSDLGWTAKIRAALPAIIKKYQIKSLLDSSCGSMHWMPLVLKEVEAAQKGFRFMGTDVACSLIDKHKTTFAKNINWKFQCVDYSNQALPSGYDMVFSRDSLQHIPMHGTWQFLNNVKASGAKYLLVGSYLNATGPNGNIAAGQYYDINLLKEPFKVSKPLEIIDEQTQDGKHMLLFDVQKMTWQDPLDGLV